MTVVPLECVYNTERVNSSINIQSHCGSMTKIAPKCGGVGTDVMLGDVDLEREAKQQQKQTTTTPHTHYSGGEGGGGARRDGGIKQHICIFNGEEKLNNGNTAQKQKENTKIFFYLLTIAHVPYLLICLW